MNEQEVRVLQDNFVKRKIHGALTRKWNRQHEHERDKPQYKKERRWK